MPGFDILDSAHRARRKGESMKKLGIYLVLLVLAATALGSTVWGAEVLIPVGQTVGLELDAKGVTIADFDRELGRTAQAAGLKVGDTIIKVNGQPVMSAQELRQQVERAEGALVITVLRGDKEKTVTITAETLSGGKRLGIYVREGITGIGTVTYYDPNKGSFGALGHGVKGTRGELLPMEDGKALEAEVIEIKKGKSGEPGQLKGAFQKENVLGVLDKNTDCGVFGKSSAGWAGIPLPIGEAEDVQVGEAVILSDLAGGAVQEYDVEITKVYGGRSGQGRNILLRVTDPELLEKTGGIVQGMSGSPIIQDGKLVGAVTHVLVNDPTTGYGIFIENMLDAAA